MLSIAILDDNKDALMSYNINIPELLEKNSIPGKIVIATISYEEFLQVLRSGSVNVAIIDINLETEINGMNIAQIIRDENIPVEIIFSTGMLSYISEAFKVLAFDFINKSASCSQLEDCLIRLNHYINNTGKVRKTIEIKFGTDINYIPVDDVCCIKHSESLTVVYTNNMSQFKTYQGLEDIALKSNDARLKQCHKSTFVNIDCIKKIDTKKKLIILTNGMECSIGRKFISDFK